MPEITENEQIQQRLAEDTTEVQVEGAPGWKASVPKENLIATQIPKTKAKRTQATKSTAKTSVGDTIALMQQKIGLLQYVDSISVPEVPIGMSKDGRELLLGIGKDVEAMKNRLISAIQKL